MSRKHSFGWVKLAIAGAIVGIFVIAHAARENEPAAESAGSSVSHNALQIAVTEGGQLVAPSADEARALRGETLDRMRSSRRAAPTATRHDDGTMSLVVGADQLNFLTVRRDDDGTLTFDHGAASSQDLESTRKDR